MIFLLARSSSTNRNSRSTSGSSPWNDRSERSSRPSMLLRSAGKLTVSRCSATASTCSTSSRYDWRIRNMRARFVATLPCVLGVVVAVGCGDNLPGAAGSGTRLGLHSYVFEDGTELVDPTRFRDLARGEDCAPALWSDGASYCTPAAGD